MNVLVVLPSVPLPADSGGAIRTLQLLLALARNFRVTALTLQRPERESEKLRDLLGPQNQLVEVAHEPLDPRELASATVDVLHSRPLRYRRYAGLAMQAALGKLLASRKFDVVHFDHLHTAQLLPLVRKLQPEARIVIDEHNVEARILLRMAATLRHPRRALMMWQTKRVLRLEENLIPQADLVLACSEVDATELRHMGARQVQVVPNGVCLESVRAPPAERSDLIFVGAQDWWPNADASRLLVQSIWPLIAQKVGNSRLLIVGRNPPSNVRALAGERVEVTGGVPAVGPYLARAWATAMPLRAGSGTRLKILEAAAAGVPIVATRLAAEGIPMRHGEHVLFAETPEEFASALLQVHTDPALAAHLVERMRTVAENYTWNAIGQQLVDSYVAAMREGEYRRSA
jgi:glycosyltransferase involved in cell wall biosynthesis